MNPLNGILGLPTDVIAGLRTLPDIADHTEEMAEHTAVLDEVKEALRRVSSDTDALPALLDNMASVAETTAVLGRMDGRMATIEETMPALIEVERHLAALPETVSRLDERIDRLSMLMEQMLVSLDGLAGSVGALQNAVEPMGRLASRLPGRRE